MFFEPAPQPPLLQASLTTMRNYTPPTLHAALNNAFSIPLNAEEVNRFNNMLTRVPQGAHPAFAAMLAVGTVLEGRNQQQLHRDLDLAVATSVLGEELSSQTPTMGN